MVIGLLHIADLNAGAGDVAKLAVVDHIILCATLQVSPAPPRCVKRHLWNWTAFVVWQMTLARFLGISACRIITPCCFANETADLAPDTEIRLNVNEPFARCIHVA